MGTRTLPRPPGACRTLGNGSPLRLGPLLQNRDLDKAQTLLHGVTVGLELGNTGWSSAWWELLSVRPATIKTPFYSTQGVAGAGDVGVKTPPIM